MRPVARLKPRAPVVLERGPRPLIRSKMNPKWDANLLRRLSHATPRNRVLQGPQGPQPPAGSRSSTPITALIIVAVVAVVGGYAYMSSGRGATEQTVGNADHGQQAQNSATQTPDPRWAKLGPHKQANLPPIPSQEFAPPRPIDVVRAAYLFAAEHPEILSYVPCFCGCERGGHSGNEDCFVAATERQGRRHGVGTPRSRVHGLHRCRDGSATDVHLRRERSRHSGGRREEVGWV